MEPVDSISEEFFQHSNFEMITSVIEVLVITIQGFLGEGVPASDVGGNLDLQLSGAIEACISNILDREELILCADANFSLSHPTAL